MRKPIGCFVVSLIACYPKEYEVRVNFGLSLLENEVLSLRTMDLDEALHWFKAMDSLMKALDGTILVDAKVEDS